MRIKICVFLFTLLFSQLVSAVSINEINEVILKKGAKWTAGKTSVWDIPFDEKKEMMGAPIMEEREFQFHVVKNSVKDLPVRLDWRDQSGLDYMPLITNQGRCGSCVAFAAVGAMEGQVNIANGWPGLDMDFSEQQLFGCGGGGCNTGWYPSSAASYLVKNGVVDEACLPYTSGSTGEDVSCSAKCLDSSTRITKLKSYDSVGGWFGNDQKVMEALQYGPLLGTMIVYEDFIAYTGGVYQYVTGKRLGGHAITLVGYDNQENYWIVRNSWGTSWGEDGYFRIRMGDKSGVGKGTYSFDVEPFGGTARIEAPMIREVISGSYQVKLQSTVAGTHQMKLELLKDGQTTVYGSVRGRSVEQFITNLDTTTLQDGVYQARAVSIYKDGGVEKKKRSQFRRFFVLNGTPVMEVGILSPQNGAKLKERVIVKLLAKGTPIPVMKLVFNLKDKDGNVKKIVNQSPAETTLMSWKTQNGANGTYEIWVEGFAGNHKIESEHISVTVNN